MFMFSVIQRYRHPVSPTVLQEIYNKVVACSGVNPVGPFAFFAEEHSENQHDNSLLFTYTGDGLTDEEGREIADAHSHVQGGFRTTLIQNGNEWHGLEEDEDDDD